MDPDVAVTDVGAEWFDTGRLTVTTTTPKHCSSSADTTASDNNSTFNPFTSSKRSPIWKLSVA
jgi:hypothetical protein